MFKADARGVRQDGSKFHSAFLVKAEDKEEVVELVEENFDFEGASYVIEVEERNEFNHMNVDKTPKVLFIRNC